MHTISAIQLDQVTGGDQLGSELDAALAIGMHQKRTRDVPWNQWARDHHIRYDRSLGAWTDGFGIVNGPPRSRR